MFTILRNYLYTFIQIFFNNKIKITIRNIYIIYTVKINLRLNLR